uniref:Uncharacterized protein n=1 Tax=Cacopsylla melanoneura TaxID=428564 RepID=A0A8D8T446_9HEMI
MLSPSPFIPLMLIFALLMMFVYRCSSLETGPYWRYNIDPSDMKDQNITSIMDFKPFLNMTKICEDGLDSKCTEDFAAALKKGNTLVKKDDALRKGCDYDDYLQRKVCWIRRVTGFFIGQMKRTKFELQFWFDHDKNRSMCRYNYPYQ